MLSVVLFDLDGTLVDTMPVFAALAADVMHRHYGLPLTEARDLYRRTSGVPFRRQLRELFGPDPRNHVAGVEFERRKDPVAGAARMELRTQRALRSLRASGLRLVISSNGAQRHVDRFAATCPGLFACALGDGPVGGKGEAHVARVCQALDAARTELVFVGDSLRDHELATATSIPFVARAGTFARTAWSARFPATPIIDDVDELAPLLASMQPARQESA